MTARDLKWWETTYERLLSPTVRESRYVPGRQGPAPPPPPVKHPCMDCQEDISELENHKWRKRCESCQVKFSEDSTERRKVEYLKQKGSTVGFETKVAPVLRLRSGYQRPPRPRRFGARSAPGLDSIEGGRGA